jgi:large-conductance mechanosensitive channel
MTTSALITMLIAWIIIGFFMLRFLIKVLNNPYKKEEEKSEA